ncbi:hypothetical protein SU69_07555 [Thermosipho melanesiensis]|uniref:Resolvase, N-terminal domain n=2 Tax=Thermosipho melanesiensis TaxID=46541 RepID=A6LN32_THEM4|nr:recombinase family protein [Thermosipho melanesiensis]ABR31333.1 Resolvase, N-terminal domain [Thermosipho melanesiensis BI429]APT74927.1 hypothetical protein BW47_07910 [Thermosipho melanesiensis]OOC36356.1 hypothetical protein SU68_07625 [Thermosipho melanesiensis]OOC37174.1 hypothetical protein SU69_07555 [Thermosipho melanesiensis]OOC37926.1 hypothetical protein SU70_07565 [Thermosipho melanesiensis]
MKRAAAYARYSSDRQSDTSIEAQLEKIRKYCEEKGYVVVKEYIDRAQSAATDKRIAFQQMFKDAENHEFDVVVVYKLDRFARNLYDSVVYTKKLEELNIALESTTEPITQDIAGKFFRNIMGAINELYIENLKQEIRDKAIVVAKKGYFMGGVPPFGFKLVEETDEYGKKRKRYEIDENEAPYVREIFQLASQGVTLRQIADKLNQKGLKTRRGNKWTVRALYEMILNEKYAGIYTYQKGTKHNYHANREDVIRIPGVIPAIVDEETYWNARNKLGIGSKRVKRHHYLLNGILYCAVCGNPMNGGAQSGDYPRYMCSYAKRFKEKGHVSIGKKKIEDYVLTHIKHTFFTNVDFEKLAKQLNKELNKTNKTKEKQIQKLKAELAEINLKLQRATQAILAGVELDTLKDEIEKLKQQKIEKEFKLEKVVNEETPSLITPEGLQLLWNELQKLLETEKELVIKKLIERITVYPDGFIDIKYRNVISYI